VSHRSLAAVFSYLLHSPVRAAGHLWRALNERWLRITTVESTPVLNPGTGQPPVPCHADNYAYSTPDYLDLRRILSRAQLTPADVFYDIGCGLGRVVCLAARRRITKAVGIELNPGLAAIARRNGERLRGRRAPIEIRVADAVTADLGDGTFFYLFNPFGAETLRAVLASIERSLAARPRAVRIVYVNPQHAAAFDEAPWLEPHDALKTFRNLDVRFYRSRR
jgi:SAM-dependent methyltransferase